MMFGGMEDARRMKDIVFLVLCDLRFVSSSGISLRSLHRSSRITALAVILGLHESDGATQRSGRIVQKHVRVGLEELPGGRRDLIMLLMMLHVEKRFNRRRGRRCMEAKIDRTKGPSGLVGRKYLARAG
jgi:hypothetical protein